MKDIPFERPHGLCLWSLSDPDTLRFIGIRFEAHLDSYLALLSSHCAVKRKLFFTIKYFSAQFYLESFFFPAAGSALTYTRIKFPAPRTPYAWKTAEVRIVKKECVNLCVCHLRIIDRFGCQYFFGSWQLAVPEHNTPSDCPVLKCSALRITIISCSGLIHLEHAECVRGTAFVTC